MPFIAHMLKTPNRHADAFGVTPQHQKQKKPAFAGF